MNIYARDLDKLDQKGVYCIVNTRNNKIYIGSTSTSFQRRFLTHYWRLVKNNHENKYLQNAWNKDEKHFIFRIMLVTDDLSWEQRAFNLYKPFNKRGYNLNLIASKPPFITDKKIFIKRAKCFSDTVNIALQYYKDVLKQEIPIEDVPLKYAKLVNHYLTRIPWNKGMQGYCINKYPTNRKMSIEGLFKRREAFKKLRKEISVYKDDIFLKKYKDIEDLINDPYLKQFVSLYKSKTGTILKAPNIYQSCRTNKPYKGLMFKYSPLE